MNIKLLFLVPLVMLAGCVIAPVPVAVEPPFYYPASPVVIVPPPIFWGGGWHGDHGGWRR